MKPFDKDVQRLVGAYLGVRAVHVDCVAHRDFHGGGFFSEFEACDGVMKPAAMAWWQRLRQIFASMATLRDRRDA